MTDAVTGDLDAADLSSNELERHYATCSDIAYRRKHGQFFTPFCIAGFMSQWIAEVSAANPKILDPCAGLGVFERALLEVRPEFAGAARFELWEKDEVLARGLTGVCRNLAIRHSVSCRDFLDEHSWSEAYDAVIANPPYYKHHFVENKESIRNTFGSRVGADFSVQTNIYCWFLVKALALLKHGGRLAFIIPTEFLNANYGRNVKRHLLDKGCLRHIISICYKSKTFDDAITTACVLLAEKDAREQGSIRFYRAESIRNLGDIDAFLADTEFREYRCSEIDAGRKWRSLFPGNKTFGGSDSRLVPLSTYGRFSRGIATGANAFFALRGSSARARGLPRICLIPCVSKARQAPGKVFRREDFEALDRCDQAVYLFDGRAAVDDAVMRYIAEGEASGYHGRYLTRGRRPWYTLEKRQVGRIWVGVFGRAGIRFVWNDSDCVTLTCFHVFQQSDIGREFMEFLFLYLNSETGRAFLELEKREYGGGLEKYEPNDINGSLAPDFSLLDPADIDRLGRLQREFLSEEAGTEAEVTILTEADSIFGALISQR